MMSTGGLLTKTPDCYTDGQQDYRGVQRQERGFQTRCLRTSQMMMSRICSGCSARVKSGTPLLFANS
eukprot:198370-Pelagomonas_calceolata.AAC.1